MGMFRLDIKKNILMKREGSHVGDVLIKMSERPGHAALPQLGSSMVTNKALLPRVGWSLASFQFPFPWRRPRRWGMYMMQRSVNLSCKNQGGT